MRTRLCVLVLLFALLGLDAGAVTMTRVTVATTATLIYTAPIASTGRVLIRNPSAVSVFVGSAAVLTSTGFEIAAGDSLAINLSYGDTIYGIVAAATQVVYTIQGANPQ